MKGIDHISGSVFLSIPAPFPSIEQFFKVLEGINKTQNDFFSTMTRSLSYLDF
jgi:hypothetical protein